MPNDHAKANSHCPSYFSRRTQSARLSHRELLIGLRELHLRQALVRDCTGIPLATPPLVEVQGHGQIARARTATGVTIDFILEVARHFSPTETVASISAIALDPAAKPHGTCFASIPGLTHARFKGPPEFIVAYDQSCAYHDIAKALEQHALALMKTAPGRPAPTYWLPCFACAAHVNPLRLHGSGGSGITEARVQGARSASHTAQAGILLLDSKASTLSMALPLADLVWTLKAKGSQVRGRG